METTSGFVAVVITSGAVVTLLNIILFFKVWGMTNNTAKIKDILQEWLDLEHPEVDDEDPQIKK